MIEVYKEQVYLRSEGRYAAAIASLANIYFSEEVYDKAARLCEEAMKEIEAEFEGCGYGKFKPVVGEAVIETLRPIREEATRLLKDKAYLESVYRNGAEKASYVAEKTLRKVYKKVGFLAK